MKKWMVVVSVIVILVLGIFIIGLFNSGGKIKCASIGCDDPRVKCPPPNTTCKTQCDNTSEIKIDAPFSPCDNENQVCCQKRPVYPLK